ncbi:peroxisomal trans-2-enoyl-CoA reductase-like [Lingula anatina]|uniref:Peroxisomal trans-2-enoyl-CoA reductase n=1 Tax=Lingula anatina TaxID=7574 RepID=A0A1S3ILE2_LINAN|nr:peroxisomal trans-2-enoyl-CoA reductase-like [Lingula anatina]|eukprot:XP_013398339.1 peroxisomal trans-2-enoyl-CoA reductase-like [Lingula anatina]
MASSISKVRSVFRPGLFAGKVAIVTGGSTGIGKAITQELLSLGCKVMIASRNEERLMKMADVMRSQLPSDGPAWLEAMPCNIRKEDQVQHLMKETLSKYGRIDYLVNNGGGQFMSPAEDIRLKGWNAVIETNLTGTFLCCKEAYHHWMKENGGSIVNIIVDLWKGFPRMSHSGAARAGILNLTKSLAVEWADHGVRINCVAPGSSIYSETAAANYNDPEVFNAIIPLIPAKRLGTTEEVSAAVCFLLSPAAAFITGDTIKVDGGSNLYSSVWVIPDHKKIPAFKWEDEEEDSKSKL